MNHGPHDICRSCETVEHCSSAGCIPLTTSPAGGSCSMNPDSLPSFDADAQQATATFGHHPDPAIDFCVEVEAIEAEIADQRAGLPPQFDLATRIEQAMQFKVGGDPAAVVTKAALRVIESAFGAGKRAAHPSAAPQGAQPAEPVAKVVSWTNGSYSRNYKLEWLRDVPEGALLYASPADAAPVPQEVRVLTPDDARQLLCVRDYLDAGKINDAVYALTAFADPEMGKVNPWKSIEELAGLTIPATVSAPLDQLPDARNMIDAPPPGGCHGCGRRNGSHAFWCPGFGE